MVGVVVTGYWLVAGKGLSTPFANVESIFGLYYVFIFSLHCTLRWLKFYLGACAAEVAVGTGSAAQAPGYGLKVLNPDLKYNQNNQNT